MSNVDLIFMRSSVVEIRLASELRKSIRDLIFVDLLHAKHRIDGASIIIAKTPKFAGYSVNSNLDYMYDFSSTRAKISRPASAYSEANIAGTLEITKFAGRSDLNEIILPRPLFVYGPSGSGRMEKGPPNPASACASSKPLTEKIHSALTRKASAKLMTVRLAVLFSVAKAWNVTRPVKILSNGFLAFFGRKAIMNTCILFKDLSRVSGLARSTTYPHISSNGHHVQSYTVHQIVVRTIVKQSTNAKLNMIPRAFVSAADILTRLRLSTISLFFDRPVKFLESDLSSAWPMANSSQFPGSLDNAIERRYPMLFHLISHFPWLKSLKLRSVA